MKDKKYKKIYLTIILFITVLTLVGGTLAYWQWNVSTSQRTNLVLTVEETYMCEADGGGNITDEDASLAPASCTNSEHAIQRKITVKPSIFGNHAITMDLWLEVNAIESGLVNSENFKYAITTVENSCTEGVIKTGTFYGKITGSKIILFDYKKYNETTTDTFYLYIWLDKEETSQNTMDQKFNLSLNGTCEDSPTTEGQILYDLIDNYAVADNITSKYVSSTTGINFAYDAGTTNGQGVYTMASTINDDYPVHYYRGEVNNNNVIFANNCWKIVRTTETGGTKLIYNGPASNGKCNNTGKNTQIGSKIPFGTNGKLEASGYAYGITHSLSYKAASEIGDGVVFANNVTYENGEYIYSDDIYIKDSNLLTDPSTALKTHHYTCFKTAGETCKTMYFVFMVRGVTIYYITLKEGETIDTAISNGLTNSTNTTSSNIKTFIDNWYSSNMTDYTKYLEDTIWCNDRSISSMNGWTINGELLDTSEHKLNYGAANRMEKTKKPDLNCANPGDRFTVSSSNGNGALTYPVALLTLDEAALAGYVWMQSSGNNYLNNDQIWWTMSPTLISVGNTYVGVLYSIADNIHVSYTSSSTAGGVRPAISLKYGTTIEGGYGTIELPYIINEGL